MYAAVLDDVKAMQLVRHTAQCCFAYDSITIVRSTESESQSKDSLCRKPVNDSTVLPIIIC